MNDNSSDGTRRTPGVVSVWAGHLVDEEAAFDHVQFDYADDGLVGSPFAREHELGWYDEDFAELSWSPEESPRLADFSYGTTFEPTAQADLDAIPDVNTVYVIYDLDASARPHPSGTLLTFVGSYTYRRT